MVPDIWLDTSSGPKWPRCSFRVSEPKVKKFLEISWFYWINLMILEEMVVCLWKLLPWFWTYGLIRLLGPGSPDVVSRSQTPRSRNILRFHNFIGFISWFLRKWCPVLKIEAGLLDLWLGMFYPIGPNVVSRPQTPRYYFIGFISWFLRKGLPIFGYIFWAQLAQM